MAVYTIKLAAAKSSLSFSGALVYGIFCNVLVCLGVFIALSAQDISGRLLGAFLPAAYFVAAGFEHSVANMYYISAGLFANQVPAYAAKAVSAGVYVDALAWGAFFFKNLFPVTLGNIIGGAAVGVIMWASHLSGKAKQ